MKAHPVVFWSAGTLALVGGVTGFVLGQKSAVTESDLINRAAASYVAETGRPRLDCVGLPGRGNVWIMVRCGDAQVGHLYAFDRSGRRIAAPKGPDA